MPFTGILTLNSNMRPFTKEELDALSKYEQNFKTAVYQNYARNLTRQAQEEIRKTYEDALGKPYSPNGTCSHCLFNMLKLVGKKYFEDKEAYKEKAAELVEVLDEVFGEVPDEEPKPTKKAAAAAKKPKKTTKKK